MAKKEDITGLTFNRLTAISWAGHRGKKNIWNCLCECGNRSIVEIGSLKSGKVKSCGCYGAEIGRKVCIERNTTHNLSNSKIYTIWWDMMRRCNNPVRKAYKDYGGRNIKVSDEWLDFNVFYKDMGHPQEKHSLDRIDNSRGYSKDNCQWADLKTQANNRRNNKILIINDERLTMMQASEKYKIHYTTLRSRLRRGWSIERAINE